MRKKSERIKIQLQFEILNAILLLTDRTSRKNFSSNIDILHNNSKYLVYIYRLQHAVITE